MKPSAADIVGLLGLAAVVNGVRLWSVPAAWLAAGLAGIGVAYLLARGER